MKQRNKVSRRKNPESVKKSISGRRVVDAATALGSQVLWVPMLRKKMEPGQQTLRPGFLQGSASNCAELRNTCLARASI